MKARYIIIPVVILGAAALTTWLLINNFSRAVGKKLWKGNYGKDQNHVVGTRLRTG